MKLRLASVCLAAAILPAVVLASRKPAPAPKKLLVVSHAAGFRHSSIPTAEKTLAEIGEKSGAFTVDYCRNADDVKAMMTAENLKKYDGVFFANTTANIGIPDLGAFLDWLKSGKGFMGAHAAADTNKSADLNGDMRFVEMIGGQFNGHGRQCEIEPAVEDRQHPSTAHLGSTYKIFDEIYLFKDWDRTKCRSLLSMDKHPPDGNPKAGEPGDYPVAWCKAYGKGKVFYTSLGHREDVWENETYRQHLLGGIRWALGLAKGKSEPILRK
jgi:type 1 glutamine amidotransferase